MKPPSRKHYEKSEVERLKDRIAKLEKDRPEALGIRTTIDSLRTQVKSLREDSKYLQEQLVQAGRYEAYFKALTNEEVFVASEEGMKYLKGDDLEAYCKAVIKKQDEERHVGYETINLGHPLYFAQYANQALNQILRDEIDKLDTFKYTTKGRYNYDPRSKSKKEGS